MKILVVDNDMGNGQLSFIMRAQDDGHTVRWWGAKPIDWKAKPIGKGIATIVADWRDHIRWADLVILGDNTRLTIEMDRIRAQGKPVIGATTESATWELERQTGQLVFKKAGIPVPPYKEFKHYDDAIRYVEREGRAFVSKPNGDEEDKSLSYVAKSPADLVYMLKRWKAGHRHKDSFILQEKVSGIELAVGAWVGPQGFTHGWCENWEHKKLFVGDLGVATGEMGTALMHTARSKLAGKVLAPLEEVIVKTGHTGYVDVNCIVDDEGTPWPLEFTMRSGYPTWPIQQSLLKGDVAEWLLDLAEGRDAKPWVMETAAVGVVLACGAFPHGRERTEDIVGIPIYGTEGMLDRLGFCEVMAGSAPHDVDEKVVDQPCFCTAGNYVLVASGTGDTVTAARRSAYRTITKLKLPSSPFYRTDIGLRLAKQLPEAQALGYAKAWTY